MESEKGRGVLGASLTGTIYLLSLRDLAVWGGTYSKGYTFNDCNNVDDVLGIRKFG
jgi:hypothetical protein